ncbi:patatin-like phospholipase family protein [Massilia sp. CF038]|uniref:patatin-like phospholipase family protein n=1 Tax=Massilia sp. CF038 TaxID=1881045 RepID=UPI0009129DCA|nr:patatin-like phospholipase family protein [Massilia sp. CF038]SHG58804.1 NTE family protein [Massilia sp. CF038]
MPTLFRTLGAATALLILLASPALARPKVGLVLSGGGARGVAHIGVLKVLEEMHIPVDYVVGTSMGSIVAGAYAMGNDPKDLAARLQQVRWNEVLDDNPPRLERTPYTKNNERNSISSRELGFRDAELQFPRGLNYGQQIEFFFNTLAARTGDIDHFDQLDIPFRAVATDIENGKMVVLDRGAIARAMRASMSVPGVFAPVEIDGRALLDGGLVRNLPVDVARSMGADIVIAVNLGTALLKRDQIVSVFGVGQQMLNILTEQNVENSLRQLGPRDILITPALGDYSAADFDNATSTIVIGEAAARAVAPQLATLSLNSTEWEAHMAARRSRHLDAGNIAAVRIDPFYLRHVSVAAVQAKLTIKPGTALKMSELQANLNSLYASGNFQNVNHRFEQDAGGRTLVIEPVEKEWGPNYLRGGFRLSTDLAGQSDFSILLNHRSTWLTPSGLEWRNDVSLGQVMLVNSQLYQPLDVAGNWFVAPVLRLSQTRDNLIINERPVATYRIRQQTVGLDLGHHIGNTTTLRFGLERGSSRASPSVAVPDFPSQSEQIGVVRMEFLQDRLDDWVFPTTGTFAFANARLSSTGLGADQTYRRVEAGLEGVWGIRQHRISLAARGGKIWGDDAPLTELFSLGGVLNMTGYPDRQFLGASYAYSRAMYSRQTEIFGLKNIYLGGTVEAGRMTRRFNGEQVGTKFSTSVFGAINTGLGPFTLGLGIGEDGNHSFYLFFGKP